MVNAYRACSSVGATLSTLLKATDMSDKERNIVLDVTSDCLKRLAKVGGPISYFEVLNKNN